MATTWRRRGIVGGAGASPSAHGVTAGDAAATKAELETEMNSAKPCGSSEPAKKEKVLAYVRNGGLFCTVGGEEHELIIPREAKAVVAAKGA